MLSVLKATPGVSEPRLGYVTRDGRIQPFLEYRAAEKSSWVEPTRFDAQRANTGHLSFMAMLPGLGQIDYHVTAAVVQGWKTKCGVEAFVLFE